MLAGLAGQPPALIYAVIAAFSFFENWLPPLPADTAIGVGAFLSSRGQISPLGVFLATWLANVAGAMSVWAASHRYGRQFFLSDLGRRLFSEQALAFAEREYARFGGLGLFVVKLLPGVRAIAAPFAGMAAVPFWRALWPMALASALWYGGVTLVGTVVGRQWATIATWLRAPIHLVPVLIAVALVAVLLLLRRRRPRD